MDHRRWCRASIVSWAQVVLLSCLLFSGCGDDANRDGTSDLEDQASAQRHDSGSTLQTQTNTASGTSNNAEKASAKPPSRLTHVLTTEVSRRIFDEQRNRREDRTLPVGTKVAILKRHRWTCFIQLKDGTKTHISGGKLCAIGELSDKEITADVRSVADANNRFAVELYDRLRTREGNLFFSPASLCTAFSMVYAGAGGETKSELAATLHFELPDQQLHDAFGVMNRVLNSSVSGTGYRLRMANRLWGQVGYEFVPDFLGVTREHYGAELASVDFAEQPVETCRSINTWIEKQTEGKIQDLVSPTAIRSLTRLVLTNAVYFHGDWTAPLKSRQLRSNRFTPKLDRTSMCR